MTRKTEKIWWYFHREIYAEEILGCNYYNILCKNFKSDQLAQNLVHIDFEDLQVYEFHSLAWQARKIYQICLYHQVLNSVMNFIWTKNGQPFAFLITDYNFLLQDLQISLFLVCWNTEVWQIYSSRQHYFPLSPKTLYGK